VPLARGRIKLHRHVPKESLEGLKQFSHVWLLFVFHLNTDLHQTVVCSPHEQNTGCKQKRNTAKAKVRVPRLGGEKRGVFATRSPHRPVPIGLSLVQLRRVESDGRYFEVIGADLVDGTPILDMKPYIPFSDAPQSSASPVFVPDWVTSAHDCPEEDFLHAHLCLGRREFASRFELSGYLEAVLAHLCMRILMNFSSWLSKFFFVTLDQLISDSNNITLMMDFTRENGSLSLIGSQYDTTSAQQTTW